MSQRGIPDVPAVARRDTQLARHPRAAGPVPAWHASRGSRPRRAVAHPAPARRPRRPSGPAGWRWRWPTAGVPWSGPAAAPARRAGDAGAPLRSPNSSPARRSSSSTRWSDNGRPWRSVISRATRLPSAPIRPPSSAGSVSTPTSAKATIQVSIRSGTVSTSVPSRSNRIALGAAGPRRVAHRACTRGRRSCARSAGRNGHRQLATEAMAHVGGRPTVDPGTIPEQRHGALAGSFAVGNDLPRSIAGAGLGQQALRCPALPVAHDRDLVDAARASMPAAVSHCANAVGWRSATGRATSYRHRRSIPVAHPVRSGQPVGASTVTAIELPDGRGLSTRLRGRVNRPSASSAVSWKPPSASAKRAPTMSMSSRRPAEPALVEGGLVERQQARREVRVVLEHSRRSGPAVLPRPPQPAIRGARRGRAGTRRCR